MPFALPAFPQAIRDRKIRTIGWCGFGDPGVAGIMAKSGFDCILLDQQHGAFDYLRSHQAIGEANAFDKPALVRIGVGDFQMASRMLDAGAAAIVAPMINSVEDARRFAAFVKFPALGERSWGPGRALQLADVSAADYLATANSFSLAIAMCETRASLAVLDDILAVPGIDGILVGPADLTIALTDGASNATENPETDKAMRHILARCKASGKFACAFGTSPQRAQTLLNLGYDLVSITTDTMLFRDACTGALQALNTQ